MDNRIGNLNPDGNTQASQSTQPGRTIFHGALFHGRLNLAAITLWNGVARSGTDTAPTPAATLGMHNRVQASFNTRMRRLTCAEATVLSSPNSTLEITLNLTPRSELKAKAKPQ